MKVRLSGMVLVVGLLAWPGCGSSGSAAPSTVGDGGAREAAMAVVDDSGASLPDAGSVGVQAADGGVPADGGPADASIALGQPIAASSGQWTWVDFDNAFCANGSTTGLGINPSSTSSNVLIYLEGGGACWDALTCYTTQTAANVETGYGASQFQTESTDTSYLAQKDGFFDRTSATNPFKDYSYVYVPYCTGDIYAGNNVVTLGSTVTHFVGYENVTAYLSRLVPTFPAAAKVVLSGSSAGGLGALWNWYQTQQAFGTVRVDLLDDSGTFMPSDIVPQTSGNSAAWTSAWKLASTAPPCAACGMDPSALYGYYGKLYPTHRGALLSYTQDSTLPTYYGITTSQFTTGLDEDMTNEFTPNANLGAFLENTSGHVLFFDPTLTAGSKSLETWVTQMVTDDPAWATAGP